MRKNRLYQLISGALLATCGHLALASMEEAWNAYDAGDFEEAYQHFSEEANTGDAENQFLLAMLLLDAKETDPARLKEGVKMLKQSAEQGNVKALYNLAILYEAGLKGVKSSNKKAFNYYQKAADLKFLPAVFMLGLHYIEGELAPKDLVTGIELLELADQLGDDNAGLLLGMLYYSGEQGIEQDLEKALDYINRAADKKRAIAYFLLSDAYSSGTGVEADEAKAEAYQLLAVSNMDQLLHDPADATLITLYGDGLDEAEKATFARLQKSADAGNAAAAYQLGVRYYYGTGVAMDEGKAAEYLTSAAEKGHIDAMIELTNLAESEEESIKWLEKAAVKGSVEAYRLLGKHFSFEYGDDQDIKKGFDYYQKAAELGDLESQQQMADFYDSGYLVDRDLEKAFYWYQKAANQGDAKAQYHIALSFDQGLGVDSDPKKAFDSYLKLVDAGGDIGVEAYLKLAQFYQAGEVVEKSIETALHYYELAIEQSYGGYRANIANLAIAKIYAEGIDVPQDLPRAIDIYETLSKADNGDALYLLGQLYDEGRGVKKDPERAKSLYLSSLETYQNYEPEAMFALAELLFPSNDLEERKQAFLYYIAAESDGLDSASQRLYELANNGESDAITWIIAQPRDDEKSFNWIKAAAEKGDAQFEYELARRLEYLEGSKKEVLQWFQRSAEQGYYYAQKRMGDFYFYDERDYRDLLEKDRTLAIKWYKDAVKATNDSGLAKRIGRIYEEGDITQRDFQKAKEWYQQAADWGDEDSADSVKQIDTNLAKLQMWEKAAKENDPDAFYGLYELYQKGRWVPRDLEKSREYEELAAKAGHSKAQYDVAERYREDIHYRDEKTISNYYLAAAEDQDLRMRDRSSAQEQIANRFIQGLGVEEDREMGRHWAEQADKNLEFIVSETLRDIHHFDSQRKQALKGNAVAERTIGIFYYQGRGIKQNYQKAYHWLKKASNQEDAVAKRFLATFYEEGILIPKSYPMALKLYDEASELDDKVSSKHQEFLQNVRIPAEEGDVAQMSALGDYYYTEAFHRNSYWNVDKEAKQEKINHALMWYRKGADANDAIAQYQLYRWYNNEKGYFSNAFNREAVAQEYLEKAAENGYAEAQYQIAEQIQKEMEQSDHNTGHNEQLEKWYQAAADQGNLAAINRLIESYLYGIFTLKDEEKVLARYDQLINHEDADEEVIIDFVGTLNGWERTTERAQYLLELGKIYQEGKGVFTQNSEKAIEWYQKAFDQGSFASYFAIAELYREGATDLPADIEKAISYYDAIAGQNLEATLKLARLYDNAHVDVNVDANISEKEGDNHSGNITIKPDLKKAEQYYRQAARMGSDQAIDRLAVLYQQIMGELYNPVQAKVMLDLLDERNYYHRDSHRKLNFLTLLNDEERKVAEDEVKEWLSHFKYSPYQAEVERILHLAEQQQSGSRYFDLGKIYLEGDKVAVDPEQADAYFMKAGELGYLFAYNYLGNRYRNGDFDFPKSMEKAVELFKIAADQGDSNCAHQLGDIYYFGEDDIEQDYDIAATYYALANPQDGAHHCVAKYKLARIYYNGYGSIAIDKHKAKELLEEAASYDDELALKALETWEF